MADFGQLLRKRMDAGREAANLKAGLNILQKLVS